jgi:hypothetical protein
MKRANYATALHELAKAVRDIADKKNVALEDAGCAIVAEAVLKKLKARDIAGLLTLRPVALVRAAQSINRQVDRIAAGRIACLLALVSGEENPDPAVMLGRGERLIELLAVANRPENYCHRWPEPVEAVREHMLFKSIASVQVNLPTHSSVKTSYSLRRGPGCRKIEKRPDLPRDQLLCLIIDAATDAHFKRLLDSPDARGVGP